MKTTYSYTFTAGGLNLYPVVAPSGARYVITEASTLSGVMLVRTYPSSGAICTATAGGPVQGSFVSSGNAGYAETFEIQVDQGTTATVSFILLAPNGQTNDYSYIQRDRGYDNASGVAPLWNSVVLSGSYRTGYGG